MAYKPFAFSVSLRTGLLLINLVTLAFLFARRDLFFTQFILLLLLIYQIYELTRFITQTNRALARFLSALQYGEYSVHFSGQGDSSFSRLYAAFDQVLASYQRVNAEKQARLQYLELIFTHLDAGVLILSAEQEAVFMNAAAGDMLQIPAGSHWQYIKVVQPNLTSQIDALVDGGRTMVELHSSGNNQLLSVHVTALQVLGKPHRLITLQDIKPEIEQKETEAWYQLIRVLTHEIMNSVTPICSLTETATALLQDASGRQRKAIDLSEDTLSDIRFSLRTIAKRSEGMLHFVENYQKLSRIPQPQLHLVSVSDLLASVGQLMQGEALKRNISLQVRKPQPDCMIQADTKLIEQVLINLVQNSLDALVKTPEPSLVLSCVVDGPYIILEVTDNGAGIEANNMTKIFMPFYSTKVEGSGIGLSLGRQIMRLHRGTLQASSEKGVRTIFQMKFLSS
ncbi:MAG: ATP-binding protein [Bacteroidota bacterium]